MDTLNFIANISGLISCAGVPIIFGICWKKNKYNLRKNTLSDCGSFPFTAKLFTFGLALFGILEIYFTYAIARNLLPTKDMWIVLPALVGGIFTVLVAVFNNHRFPNLHRFFAWFIVVLLILWCFALHILILQYHPVPGIVGLCISGVLALGTAITRKIYGECVICEIFFIAGVMIWNLYFSYIILWG